MDFCELSRIKGQELEERNEISGKPKKITIYHMREFSGHLDGGQNIHTNEKLARKAGFPDPIAQGMMSYGYILEMIITTFGHKWLNGGEMGISFLRYVFPNDTITAKGIIRSKEVNTLGAKITLEVWCENQHHQKVAAGTATGLI